MDYIEIERPKDLADLNRRLSAKLERKLKYAETRIIGSPGGSFSAKVHFRLVRGNRVFWWSGRPSRDKTAMTNLFGHGTPGSHDALNIDVQFNLPVVRFSRRRGGAFLREIRSNKIILAHRGIVTLGHGRIRKDVLFEKMDITLLEAETSSGTDEFLPIEEIGSPALIDNIDRFSRQLREIVQSIRAKSTKIDKHGYQVPTTNQPMLPAKLRKYFDEFSGRRNLKNRQEIVADWHHGKVVRALRDALNDSPRPPMKSREIDLIGFGAKKTFIFEVKTRADTQSVYTAVGQLTVHASAVALEFNRPLVKVVVLPERPNRRLYEIVTRKLNVLVLTFTRSQKGKIMIEGLKQLD
jgi:hypothetical protein